MAIRLLNALLCVAIDHEGNLSGPARLPVDIMISTLLIPLCHGGHRLISALGLFLQLLGVGKWPKPQSSVALLIVPTRIRWQSRMHDGVTFLHSVSAALYMLDCPLHGTGEGLTQ
jgi:hypothetical protein